MQLGCHHREVSLCRSTPLINNMKVNLAKDYNAVIDLYEERSAARKTQVEKAGKALSKAVAEAHF